MKKKGLILWECLHVNEYRGVLFKDFMYARLMYMYVRSYVTKGTGSLFIELFIYLCQYFCDLVETPFHNLY